MKRTIVIASVLVITILTDAHEFWLQPRKFRYGVGEEMKIAFMVGENFEGEFWDMNVHKVEKAEIHFAGGSTDLLKQVQPTKGTNLIYKFQKEGTHVVAIQSNAAYIEMDGDKFTEYLKEDGLDNILDQRDREGTSKNRSKEFYQRYAKLIVQAGNKTDETWRKRANFPIEIMPLSNPYLIKSGDYLECRVLFNGKPSAHQMVKVWSHIGNKIFLQNIYTEDDGTIKFPISSTGPWMISTVKMIASDKEGADYKSMWASLVFGIE